MPASVKHFTVFNMGVTCYDLRALFIRTHKHGRKWAPRYLLQ